jgi:Fe2+ transport system protein B
MSLVSIVISLIVVGVLLWLANTYIPMDAKIKRVLNIVVMVVVVLWLLNVFGVLDHLRNIRASIQAPSVGRSAASMVSQPGVAAGSVVPTRS